MCRLLIAAVVTLALAACSQSPDECMDVVSGGGGAAVLLAAPVALGCLATADWDGSKSKEVETAATKDSAVAAAPAANAAPAPSGPVTAAEFDARRKAIEAEWQAEIGRINRQLCQGYLARKPSCTESIKAAEAERDAELKAFDEARAKAMTVAATVPAETVSVPPAARVDRRLEVRGPTACTVVGQPASEADYHAVRHELEQCWQARIAVAQGLCDKNLEIVGQPCNAADEARKYRDAALAAFDVGWKQQALL